MIKWPVPVLSATRMEWVPEMQSDLFVFAAPSHFSDGQLKSIQKLIGSGRPVATVGSFSGGIGRILLTLAGVQTAPKAEEPPLGLCKAKNEAPELVANAPATFDDYCHRSTGSMIPEVAKLTYSDEGSPALILNESSGQHLAAWNPPNLRSLEGVPLSQVWGNTGAPYALAAATFSQLLQTNSTLHAEKIDLKQTMNIAAWRTQEGKLRILAGNLEEGLRDDADFSRRAALAIPESWHASDRWKDAWSGRTLAIDHGLLHVELQQAASALLVPSR